MGATCPLSTMRNPKSHMVDWDADHRIETCGRTGLPVHAVMPGVVDPEGTPLPRDG